jgi:hypothetical protein
MQASRTNELKGGPGYYSIGRIKASSGWRVFGAHDTERDRRATVRAMIREGQEFEADAIVGLDFVIEAVRRSDFDRAPLQRIAAFAAHYNHARHHESLANLTPADVYFGQAETILLERERIKPKTIANRRLQNRRRAAQPQPPMIQKPPFGEPTRCLKSSDDGHSPRRLMAARPRLRAGAAIYQPEMIRELLMRGGNIGDIAATFLQPLT